MKHSDRRQTISKIVSFEQKKKLKELWFNVPTKNYLTEIYHYHSVNRGIIRNHNESECAYSTPTVSAALDWIREEKGIPCSVHIEFEENNKEWFYYGEYGIKGDDRVYDTESFDTHSLAYSALLDSLLTYLENK